MLSIIHVTCIAKEGDIELRMDSEDTYRDVSSKLKKNEI